jgi:alkanesulfonate monooxygenase SsuD/methylene tetrahydromethanopterin reductase-like flavin-dependent oxidoreductase (luciferase family)
VRRAARIGAAWYPIGSNNKHLLDTLPRLKNGVDRLRQATAQAARDPASVGVAYRVKRYGSVVAPLATDGQRRLFSGSDQDVVADVRALREAGVTAIDFDFSRPTARELIAEMHRFKRAVLEKL